MQIQGLNINQISQKIAPYVVNYFKGFTLSSFKEWSFESYIFDFEEVEHLILEQYRHQFNDDDKFNGVSGDIEFISMPDECKNQKYLLMLITDSDNSRAYFLYVQELDNDYNKQRDILIADFMK